MSHAFGSAPTGLDPLVQVTLPEPRIFDKRALRLRELTALVPPLEDFLAFMARLAQVQQQVLEDREPAWRPAADAFDLALAHGLPPLGVQALRRDVDWQADLVALLDALELYVGEHQRPLLAALRACTPAELDTLADDVFEARPGEPASRGLLPLVAAALQVAWVRLAQALPSAPARPPREVHGLCPCCGSPPVASVVHNETHRSGARYLHCGICATEWHLERVRCSVCDSSRLLYLGLDDEQGKPFLATQAEACQDCHSYLKIVQREIHGRAEPVADDLATLALDMLLAEEGEYVRSGCNPLLIAGE